MAKPETSSRRDAALARAFLAALGIVAAVGLAFGETAARGLAFVPCPFRTATGVPCPGCGMSSACVSIANADPVAAWHQHPAAFALVALAIAVGIFRAPTVRTWRRMPQLGRHAILATALALVVGRWILVLIGS